MSCQAVWWGAHIGASTQQQRGGRPCSFAGHRSPLPTRPLAQTPPALPLTLPFEWQERPPTCSTLFMKQVLPRLLRPRRPRGSPSWLARDISSCKHECTYGEKRAGLGSYAAMREASLKENSTTRVPGDGLTLRCSKTLPEGAGRQCPCSAASRCRAALTWGRGRKSKYNSEPWCSPCPSAPSMPLIKQLAIALC